MKYNVLTKKLSLLDKKYIERDELKKYFKELHIPYNKGINNLLHTRYLVNIFRGVFYILSLEERNSKKINVPTHELLITALKIKNIDKWYFGLDSAIKLNNKTHETSATEYIINNKIFRPRPIKIIDKKYKFIKLKKKLFSFGIINNNINYSDLEKTILDIIYISRYNKEGDKEIFNKVIDLIEICNKKILKKYLEYYPKTMKKMIAEYI